MPTDSNMKTSDAKDPATPPAPDGKATATPTSDTPQDQRAPLTAQPLLGDVNAQDHTSGATPPPDPEMLAAHAKARAEVEAAERKASGDKASARKFAVTLYPGDPEAPKPDYRGCINGRWFVIKRGEPVELTEAQYCNVLASGEPVTIYPGYRSHVPTLTVKPLATGGRLSDQTAAQNAGLGA